MASSSRRLFAAVLLTVPLGATILVVAYAVGCLAYLAREPHVVGRLSLAARNVAIAMCSLALGFHLCKRIRRNLGSRWLWILAAPLTCLSTLGFCLLYPVAYVYTSPSSEYLQEFADRLRSQRGERLQIPGGISGVVLRYPPYVLSRHQPDGWVRIVPNHHWIQPLFGINLVHLLRLIREGGDIEIALTGDSVVKDVMTTDE